MKSSTITSFFSVTGLVPLDPDRVRSKLNLRLEELEANAEPLRLEASFLGALLSFRKHHVL